MHPNFGSFSLINKLDQGYAPSEARSIPRNRFFIQKNDKIWIAFVCENIGGEIGSG